jgi:hypothetical protein
VQEFQLIIPFSKTAYSQIPKKVVDGELVGVEFKKTILTKEGMMKKVSPKIQISVPDKAKAF